MVAAVGGGEATTEPEGPRRADRRARRRQETIDEILDIAIDVMSERGVNGLTLAEVAEAMGCAEGTVKSTLHAALSHLRVELEEDER